MAKLDGRASVAETQTCRVVVPGVACRFHKQEIRLGAKSSALY